MEPLAEDGTEPARGRHFSCRNRLNPHDLSCRLERALLGALATSLGARFQNLSAGIEVGVTAEESQQEGVLRASFYNAWRLGRSAARTLGPIRDAESLARLFEGLPVLACTSDVWLREEFGSWSCYRTRCPSHQAWGRLGCDLFREAADGLTCGLADGLRFVRLESPGRGGSACWSRIYRREEPELGWRPSAPREAEALASVRDELERRGVLIDILGLVENRMVYRPKGSQGGVDRSLPFLERAVRACLDRRLPGFEPVAAVPRPVLAEAAD